jgi:transcriptional regulator with XRE-family HTH domain
MEAESGEEGPSSAELSYTVKVGSMLRAARRQRHLSLQAVEARSGHEFKASVLGAYERGERTISVPRLVRLARVYGVSATQLVPEDEPEPGRPGEATVGAGAAGPADDVTIDLSLLESVVGPERDLLGRLLDLLQHRPGDEELAVSVPAGDLRAVVELLEAVTDTIRIRFNRLGVANRR